MGNTFSVFNIIISSIPDLISKYSDILKRISASPGLPDPNPSPSFWAVDQEIPNIAQPDTLPEHADVVIIGSGITGAAVAHTLLSRSERFQRIVIIDCRSICGGATGRNGGHIKGETWGDFDALAEEHGDEGAHRIQRFRRTSLHDLIKVDQQCCGGRGEVRNVETLDVFYTEDGWTTALQKLAIWRKAMGETGVQKSYTHEVWEGVESQEKWNVSPETKGVLWSKANVGLCNSYRLITGIFEYLTKTYPSRLQIFPHTTILSIHSPKTTRTPYTIRTSKGLIRTPRIIHGTNAHVSHFVPSLRRRIVPVRLSLTAQRPGTTFLSNLKPGTRSWCLYFWGTRYTFLSQLPQHPDGWGNGELLLGGGVNFAPDEGRSELCNTDEHSVEHAVGSYIGGALPVCFGQSNWGPESLPSEKDLENGFTAKGRVKTMWSGVMGLSSDGLPWVGKLSRNLTPRKCIPADGGEWVSAGFSGEGMVHAWGCGRAAAMMVLGMADLEGEELPKEFLITEERVKKTGGLAQVLQEFEEE